MSTHVQLNQEEALHMLLLDFYCLVSLLITFAFMSKHVV